jgi:hypothetical protein
VPSGYTSTPNAPAISASMTGDLNTGVTINVNLYNDAL